MLLTLPTEVRLRIYDYVFEGALVRFDWGMNFPHGWSLSEDDKPELATLLLAEGSLKGKEFSVSDFGHASIVFACSLTYSEAFVQWLRQTTFKTYGLTNPATVFAECCPRSWVPHIRSMVTQHISDDGRMTIPARQLQAFSNFEFVVSYTRSVRTYALIGQFYAAAHYSVLDLRFGLAMVLSHLAAVGPGEAQLARIRTEFDDQNNPGDAMTWHRGIRAALTFPEVKLTIRFLEDWDYLKAWIVNYPRPAPQKFLDHHEIMTFDIATGVLHRNV